MTAVATDPLQQQGAEVFIEVTSRALGLQLSDGSACSSKTATCNGYDVLRLLIHFFLGPPVPCLLMLRSIYCIHSKVLEGSYVMSIAL